MCVHVEIGVKYHSYRVFQIVLIRYSHVSCLRLERSHYTGNPLLTEKGSYFPITAVLSTTNHWE